MQLDLETFLSKTSPDGSQCRTTPLVVSWQDLSAQMMPSYRASSQWPVDQTQGGLGAKPDWYGESLTVEMEYQSLSTTPKITSRMKSSTSILMPATSQNGQVLVWLPGHGDGRHGGFSMLNTSAWPNDASVCSLSSILEKGPILPKYYLSAVACLGILRRAVKRAKKLPEQLRRALQAVAEKS
jgi:hypothetical protein